MLPENGEIPREQHEAGPSVLDYLKRVLRTGKFGLDGLVVPSEVPEEGPLRNVGRSATAQSSLLIFGTLMLALVAQFILEPPRQYVWLAVILYVACLTLLILYLRAASQITPLRSEIPGEFKLVVNRRIALTAMILTVLAFLAFGNNRFTALNLLLWVSAIMFTIAACLPLQTGIGRRPVDSSRSLTVELKPVRILQALVLIGIVLFFRFYALEQVPADMWSDQAEKLLDIGAIFRGEYSIFFPRNTGREGFQMYFTAGMAQLFNTGLTFLSLKLGTVLAGLIALAYTWLLARTLGGRHVALMAVLLMGMAYWPNLISRVGLRYSYYTLFAAPLLFHLIEGLRQHSRGHLIAAGVFLGLGLHGYSAFRIVPLLVILIVLLYWIAHRHHVSTASALSMLALVVIVSFVVFLPLARYAADNPDMFSYRVLTRLSTAERDYPSSGVLLFLSNLWWSLVMPFWKNGNIWVHSVPDRPALDFVSAAFYFIGLVVTGWRVWKTRDWRMVVLLLAIPVLMMPSILSIAFPEENPSLNRSAAAAIPVFIVAAYGWAFTWHALLAAAPERTARWLWKGSALLVLMIAGASNFDLTFNKYSDQFNQQIWNASEMGAVVRGFSDSVGSYDHAYVLPYAHWVDTRLVAINAGYPEYDIALWPEDIPVTLEQNGSKLFLLKANDREGLANLQSVYADGYFWLYPSKIKGKEFMLYFVPSIP